MTRDDPPARDDQDIEDSSNSCQKEKLTIEDAVDRAVTKINLKLLLLYIFAGSSMLNSAINTLATVFTGHVPYREWVCVGNSTRCIAAHAASSQDTFYTQQGLCNNDLQEGTDFLWTSQHTTFAQQWGLFCENEAKLTLISSIYFIGSFLGMLTSTGIFDRFGRKRGALFGAVISFVSVGLSTIAPNYEVLLLLRLLAGYSQIVSYTGTYCWIMELTPKSYRNLVSGTVRLNFSVSYFTLIGIAYWLDNWRYMYAACTVINAICILPLIVLPESPRFHLIRGMEKEAKSTLQSFSRITESKSGQFDLSKINLVYEIRVQNFFQQVKDFKDYPIMLKETLIAMYSWFMLACVSYGYSFGWSKIGHNIYTSCTFDAIGQSIVFVSAVPICTVLGRKNTILFFLLGSMTCNLIAMINYRISEQWTVELIASMVGAMSTNGAFLMMYLFIIERAPTSHSGMIFSLGSGSARLGSFLSPQVNLLYGVTNRRVPLGLYAGLAFLSLLGICAMPDTTGKNIPETPADIERTKRGDATGNDKAEINGTVIENPEIITEK